jgi:hypothetical protein
LDWACSSWTLPPPINKPPTIAAVIFKMPVIFALLVRQITARPASH